MRVCGGSELKYAGGSEIEDAKGKVYSVTHDGMAVAACCIEGT